MCLDTCVAVIVDDVKVTADDVIVIVGDVKIIAVVDVMKMLLSVS